MGGQLSCDQTTTVTKRWKPARSEVFLRADNVYPVGLRALASPARVCTGRKLALSTVSRDFEAPTRAWRH